MNEFLNGYYIQWDKDGIPGLQRCFPEKGFSGAYVIPDKENPGLFKTVKPGVDFFENELDAMETLHSRLQDSIHGHEIAIVRIKSRLKENSDMIQKLKGNMNAQRG